MHRAVAIRAPHELTTHVELLAAELAADPEFAAEWERLAVVA
jgi:hypothetical protein